MQQFGGEYMLAGAILLWIMSLCAFFMSIRSFMEKGFLFNNAYIYASKQEREAMNKKPHYRQSAIVFLLIGLILLLDGLDILLNTGWIFYVVIGIVIITLIFAAVSSVIIEKSGK